MNENKIMYLNKFTKLPNAYQLSIYYNQLIVLLGQQRQQLDIYQTDIS